MRGCDGNLYTTYIDMVKEIYDREYGGHSKDYEELTMEEKLLVDADVEFLVHEDCLDTGGSLMLMSGISRYTLEKYLSRLRKRDRKNGK